MNMIPRNTCLYQVLTTAIQKVEPFDITQQTIEELVADLRALFQKNQEILNYKDLFTVASAFSGSSFLNILLIFLQCPWARFLLNFDGWKELFGRYVRKGEKGIRVIITEDKEIVEEFTDKPIRKETQFRVNTFFDISQTDVMEKYILLKTETDIEYTSEHVREEYIVPMRRTRQEDILHCLELLYAYLKAEQIQIRKMPENTMGLQEGHLSDHGIDLNEVLSSSIEFLALLHLFALYRLKYVWNATSSARIINPNFSLKNMEIVADAIVFIIANYFGLEVIDYYNLRDKIEFYMNAWKTKAQIIENLQNVHAIAREIIQVLRGSPQITDSLGD